MRGLLPTIVLLVACSTSYAEDAKPEGKKQDVQPAATYDIGEFNKVYWRWKRCMNRWEQEHGAADLSGAAKLCGAEPQVPK